MHFGLFSVVFLFCRRNLADGLDKGGSYAAYYKGTGISTVRRVYAREGAYPFRTPVLGKMKTMPTEF